MPVQLQETVPRTSGFFWLSRVVGQGLYVIMHRALRVGVVNLIYIHVMQHALHMDRFLVCPMQYTGARVCRRMSESATMHASHTAGPIGLQARRRRAPPHTAPYHMFIHCSTYMTRAHRVGPVPSAQFC